MTTNSHYKNVGHSRPTEKNDVAVLRDRSLHSSVVTYLAYRVVWWGVVVLRDVLCDGGGRATYAVCGVTGGYVVTSPNFMWRSFCVVVVVVVVVIISRELCLI